MYESKRLAMTSSLLNPLPRIPIYQLTLDWNIAQSAESCCQVSYSCSRQVLQLVAGALNNQEEVMTIRNRVFSIHVPELALTPYIQDRTLMR